MNTVAYNDSELMEMTIDTPRGTLTGLFTQFRLDDSTIPDGKFVYELRHGDDDNIPATIESNVTVNYYGAFITDESIELDENGNDKFLEITDWGFE